MDFRQTKSELVEKATIMEEDLVESMREGIQEL